MGQSSSSTDSSDGRQDAARVFSETRRRSIHDSRLAWRVVRLVDSLISQESPVYNVDLTNIIHDASGVSVEQALEIITAEGQNIRSLILRFNKITEFPKLGSFGNNLRCLSLQNNLIKNLEFPDHLLPNLEDFNISGNPLQALPASIGTITPHHFRFWANLIDLWLFLVHLTHLRELYCANTMIKTLPDFVSKNHLRKLDLFNAQLIELNESIGHLVFLQWLDIGGNYLTRLPASFRKLRSLGTCACAAFSFFGSGVSYYLSEWLNLSRNTWDVSQGLFPQDASASLTKLQSLFLSGCHLSVVPEDIYEISSLTQLDLSENKLASVSMRVLNLTSLQLLNVNKNASIDRNQEFKLLVDQIEMHLFADKQGVVVWNSKMGESEIPPFSSTSTSNPTPTGSFSFT